MNNSMIILIIWHIISMLILTILGFYILKHNKTKNKNDFYLAWFLIIVGISPFSIILSSVIFSFTVPIYICKLINKLYKKNYELEH